MTNIHPSDLESNTTLLIFLTNFLIFCCEVFGIRGVGEHYCSFLIDEIVFFKNSFYGLNGLQIARMMFLILIFCNILHDILFLFQIDLYTFGFWYNCIIYLVIETN